MKPAKEANRGDSKEVNTETPEGGREGVTQLILYITVAVGRRSRSTMSSTGKAVRSSSTVTTFRKPRLKRDQGAKLDSSEEEAFLMAHSTSKGKQTVLLTQRRPDAKRQAMQHRQSC